MMGMALVAALAASVFTWLVLASREQTRLNDLDRRADVDMPEAVGIGTMLTSVIARVSSGGTLVRACEEQSRVRFATRKLTTCRIEAALTRRADERDSPAQIARMARQVWLASALSERLGCRLSDALQAVAAAHRRERLADDRRRQAFAAPEATIRLLTALPVVTVALGYVLGARPLSFLLGSSQGLMCLGLGAMFYCLGLLWTRRMLSTLNDSGTTNERPTTAASVARGVRKTTGGREQCTR